MYFVLKNSLTWFLSCHRKIDLHTGNISSYISVFTVQNEPCKGFVRRLVQVGHRTTTLFHGCSSRKNGETADLHVIVRRISCIMNVVRDDALLIGFKILILWRKYYNTNNLGFYHGFVCQINIFVVPCLQSECYWLLGLSNLLHLFELHSYIMSEDENILKFQRNIAKILYIGQPQCKKWGGNFGQLKIDQYFPLFLWID